MASPFGQIAPNFFVGRLEQLREDNNESVGDLAEKIFLFMSFLDSDYIFQEILSPFRKEEVFDETMEYLTEMGLLQYETRLVCVITLCQMFYGIIFYQHRYTYLHLRLKTIYKCPGKALIIHLMID